jgi:flagellar hook-length control protein FliK
MHASSTAIASPSAANSLHTTAAKGGGEKEPGSGGFADLLRQQVEKNDSSQPSTRPIRAETSDAKQRDTATTTHATSKEKPESESTQQQNVEGEQATTESGSGDDNPEVQADGNTGSETLAPEETQQAKDAAAIAGQPDLPHQGRELPPTGQMDATATAAEVNSEAVSQVNIEQGEVAGGEANDAMANVGDSLDRQSWQRSNAIKQHHEAEKPIIAAEQRDAIETLAAEGSDGVHEVVEAAAVTENTSDTAATAMPLPPTATATAQEGDMVATSPSHLVNASDHPIATDTPATPESVQSEEVANRGDGESVPEALEVAMVASAQPNTVRARETGNLRADERNSERLSSAGKDEKLIDAELTDEYAPPEGELAQDSHKGEEPAGRVRLPPGIALAMSRDWSQAMATATSAVTASSGSGSEASPPAMTAVPGSGVTSATATTATQVTITLPMSHPGWERAMGERLVWMVRNSLQEAQIQLNPRELGPIDVRLLLQQDQATVVFQAQQGATRDALEQSLPRLREMLADQGITLVRSEVQQQERQQQEAGHGQPRRSSPRGGEAGSDGEEDLAKPLVRNSTTLLDAYA